MRTLFLTVALIPGLALAQATQTPSAAPSAPSLRLTPVPNATLVQQRWEVQFEYPATQTQRAFDFHDQGLRNQGWQRVSLRRDGVVVENSTGTGGDLEYEAEYRRGNARAELEVENDDGTTEIELEVRTGSFGDELALNSPPNLTLSDLTGAAVRDQSWKLTSLYQGTDAAAVYTHSDRALTGQGARRTNLDQDGGEYDVDYQLGGARANLEVEREGGGVSAELEYRPS